jgi:flagellar motor switch protein FliM
MVARGVLSKEEIDALLDGVGSGRLDPGAATVPGEVRPYDIAQREHIVRGRMPTLEMINERFVRFFRTSLLNLLRRSIDVTVAPVEIRPYGEYVATVQVPSSLNLVRLAPLRGTGLIALDPRLVFAVVDNFFGGCGRFPRVEGRDFTPTERRIIDRLVARAIADLREAWSPVLAFEPEVVGFEVNPHFANIASPTESVVITRLRVELEGGGGELQFTVPYAAIEPLRAMLEAGVQSDRAEDDAHWARALREEIEDAELTLGTLLGSAQVTLGQLLDLKAGDVLPCDFAGRITLHAEGVPLFRGTCGVSRGLHAVRIEERLRGGRPLPEPPTTARKP